MFFTERLLLENRAWAESMQARDPDFFARLQAGQSPEAFWLGCSDSRVPAEQLTNASPGDLFVHRNVANVAAVDDAGFMSALEYAISALRVGHIVVCGHEGCGGVGAACAGQPTGMAHVDAHLAPVVDLCRHHAPPGSGRPSATHINDMVHRNVARQAERIADLALVREAEQPIRVIGLVYALDRGTLQAVCHHGPKCETTSRVA